MNTFLENIAEIYYNKIVVNKDNNLSLNDIIFVFPNRRAGLFFTDALCSMCSRAKQTIFSPNVVDINNFAASFTDIQKCSDVELLLLLYKSYESVAKEKNYPADKLLSFDNFISLGESMLSDFNEVDKYLCNAEAIFSNISSLKDITAPSDYFDDEQIEAIQKFLGHLIPKGVDNALEFEKKFISLWDILGGVYADFNNELDDKKLGYEGKIYRAAIENLSSRFNDNLDYNFDEIVKYKRVVFIGFNVLTASENEILSLFNKNNIGDYYFDYPMQFDKSEFKSSIALNYAENLNKFTSKYEYHQPEKEQFPEINLYSTASHSNQTKVASQLISDSYEVYKKKKDNNPINKLNSSTAIILADEQLLPHMVDNLPENIEKINVTMGYQLNQSHIATLMNNIISLQSDIAKSGGVDCFYHKPLINILVHPFIQNFYPKESGNIASKINSNNLIRVSIKELQSDDIIANNEFFKHLFSYQDNVTDLIEYLIVILKRIEESLYNQDKNNNTQYHTFDIEFTIQYKKFLNQLKNYLNQTAIEIDKKTFNQLITKMLSSLKVQFEGKPLEGLQIMGKLEARLIDYDNIIIVGFNDEKIPGNSSNNSLIPYNLRVAYKLPTYEHDDAIYAYNFYRMLYRTKKLSLIYDSRKEGGKNEISCYFYQIEHLMKHCVGADKIKINHKTTNQTISASSDEKKQITIEKNGDIQGILEEYKKEGGKRFSASSLKNYITCPLRFYYNSIAGIRQKNEVNESMQSNVFGLIYHGCMEQIYNDMYDNNLTVEKLSLTDKEIDGYIEREFAKITKGYNNQVDAGKNQVAAPSAPPLTGFNKLTANIIRNFIKQTIEFDKTRNITGKIASEEEIEVKLLDAVNFKAIIDRIDKENGYTHIIDYKTTTLTQSKSVFNIVELFYSPEHTCQEIFQVLLYCYIYKQSKLEEKSNSSEKLQPNIYNVYKLSDLIKQEKNQPEKFKLNVPNLFYNGDKFRNEEELAEELKELGITDLEGFSRDKKNCTEVKIDSYDDIAAPFEWLLKRMIDEIFDVNVSFAENPKNDKCKGCKYCPYVPLCGKEKEVASLW